MTIHNLMASMHFLVNDSDCPFHLLTPYIVNHQCYKCKIAHFSGRLLACLVESMDLHLLLWLLFYSRYQMLIIMLFIDFRSFICASLFFINACAMRVESYLIPSRRCSYSLTLVQSISLQWFRFRLKLVFRPLTLTCPYS